MDASVQELLDLEWRMFDAAPQAGQRSAQFEDREEGFDMANAVRTVSRAAIYCRGGSHEAQGRLCKEEILAHENWTLADTYADAEIPDSQMRDSRTAFNRMLEDCRKGKLDKIVTMSVSRFARNLPDGLAILRELAAAGVTVHFVKESINTESLLAHRRKRGSELAGKATMPVLVRTLDDDEATIIMVDSNLQREKILPSEKAFAYKMKLEALKHQGQRRDLTLERGVPKLPARERIALEAGESCGLAITRYIALTKLIPPLLVLVDEDKLSFSTAADYISALTAQEQTNLVSVMDKLNLIPSKGQLVKIKQHSKDGTLTPTVIEALLKAEHPAAVQVVLKQTRLRQYFPQTYTAQQMEEVIVSLLETWKIQHL